MFKRPIFWIIVICIFFTWLFFKDGCSSLSTFRTVEGVKEGPAAIGPSGGNAPRKAPIEVQAVEESNLPGREQIDRLTERLERLTSGTAGNRVTDLGGSVVTTEPETSLSYQFQNRLVPDEESLSSLGDGLVVDVQTNSVVGINVRPSVVKLLQAIDKAQRSYQAELIVLFARLNAGEKLGVEWLYEPGLGLSSGWTSRGGASGYSVGYQTADLSVVLQAAVESGRAVVDARPSIQVITGVTATVAAGREVAVPVSSSNNIERRTSVEYKEVLLSVEIKILEMAGGRLAVQIIHTNNEIGSVRLIDGNEIPELQVSEIATTLLVDQGSWYPLGGVKLVSEEAVAQGAKWLSGLPLIGRLFSVSTDKASRIESMLWLRVADQASGLRVESRQRSDAELFEAEPGKLPKFKLRNPFRRSGR